MTFLQFLIPMDDAHEVVFGLGDLGVVQFHDMNEEVNLIQRSFVNEILRIDQMQRQVRYFEDQIHKDGRNSVAIAPLAEDFKPTLIGPHLIPAMESLFEEHERDLQQATDAYNGISQNIVTSEQHVALLEKYDDFTGESEGDILSSLFSLLSFSLLSFSLSLFLSSLFSLLSPLFSLLSPLSSLLSPLSSLLSKN
jgi:vacuolar-type H+-ATPase subunit I/STV1